MFAAEPALDKMASTFPGPECAKPAQRGRAVGDRNGQTVSPQPRLLPRRQKSEIFHTPRRVPFHVARNTAKNGRQCHSFLTPLFHPCPEKSGPGIRIPLSPLDEAANWRPFFILHRRICRKSGSTPRRQHSDNKCPPRGANSIRGAAATARLCSCCDCEMLNH